jgi:hypothetical protein
MKEVAILAWCSVCWGEEDKRTEAIFDHDISVDGGPRKSIQLCAEHSRNLDFLDMESLLDSFGEPVDDEVKRATANPSKTAKQYPRHKCPYCSRGITTIGETNHIRSAHKEQFAVWSEGKRLLAERQAV